MFAKKGIHNYYSYTLCQAQSITNTHTHADNQTHTQTIRHTHTIRHTRAWVKDLNPFAAYTFSQNQGY